MCCLSFPTSIVKWLWHIQSVDVMYCITVTWKSMLILQICDRTWDNRGFTLTLYISKIAPHKGCIYCLKSNTCTILQWFNDSIFSNPGFFLYALSNPTAGWSVEVILRADMYFIDTQSLLLGSEFVWVCFLFKWVSTPFLHYIWSLF